MAIGNMHKKFGVVQLHGFQLKHPDRQRDRCTNRQTNYNTLQP